MSSKTAPNSPAGALASPDAVDHPSIGEQDSREYRVLLLPPTTRDAIAVQTLLTQNKIRSEVCPTILALCEAIRAGAGAVLVSEEALGVDPEHMAACLHEQPVWSDLPVIVLSRSGAESPTLAQMTAQLGNCSVMERPVRVTTLISVIRFALRARERQYQVRGHLEQRERDELQLRASEGQFRELADAMPQIVWVTQPDGRHEYFNHRWYEFTGIPAGVTGSEGWNEQFHPDERDHVLAEWQHSLATGEPFEVEYRLRHHSGEYRWTLGRALSIRNEDGRIERWFGTCTDINTMRQLTSEREQLLQSERSARSEAERASRMKDEFLATLSHELRTPLNAILGWAQIIRAHPGDLEDVTEGVEVIERNALTQTQIIEDLLDMSRIISGKVRLDVQPVDLSEIVTGVVQTVRPAAAARKINLRCVLDPLAAPLSGDPSRLQQIFWNLLTNAVKFTQAGGQVQVLLERVNSSVEVSVIDTGEGIEPAFLPHVFDRFRQADATTTRRHGGLGLGLAIVKQLTELHGGTVRVKSPGKGQGSTFIVSLPIIIVHPELERLPERQHPASTAVQIQQDACVHIEGVKILVVDDEADSRMMLKRILEDCHAVVETASSAAEAFKTMHDRRPDVLISDIGMPAEDGYSLIRRLRSMPPDKGGQIPAVALTAYARTEDRVKAILAGFQHHVAKPVAAAELITLVASLAGRAQA